MSHLRLQYCLHLLLMILSDDLLEGHVLIPDHLTLIREQRPRTVHQLSHVVAACVKAVLLSNSNGVIRAPR